MVCTVVNEVYGALSCVSAGYWVIGGSWWMWQMVRYRSTHLFNWLVVVTLLANILADLFEGIHYLADDKTVLGISNVMNAAKEATAKGFIFPVVRGSVFYSKANKLDWFFTLSATLGLFAFFLVLGIKSGDGAEWIRRLVELFINTLQIYYASETEERTMEAMSVTQSRGQYLLGRRCRMLQYIQAILFITFMELVFSVLVLIDASEVFDQCKAVPLKFIDVVLSKVLKTVVIVILRPSQTITEGLLLQ